MLVLAIFALLSIDAQAEKRRPLSWTHTRALTTGAAELVAQATGRSLVLRTLLDDLERTDIVVYVSDSMSGLEQEPPAYLTFVTAAAGTRYVLVRIDRWRLQEIESIARLGHELQHALEIAQAPEVRDADGIRQLYRHIGWEGAKGRFESRRAQEVGDRVWDELAGHARRSSAR